MRNRQGFQAFWYCFHLLLLYSLGSEHCKDTEVQPLCPECYSRGVEADLNSTQLTSSTTSVASVKEGAILMLESLRTEFWSSLIHELRFHFTATEVRTLKYTWSKIAPGLKCVLSQQDMKEFSEKISNDNKQGSVKIRTSVECDAEITRKLPEISRTINI